MLITDYHFYLNGANSDCPIRISTQCLENLLSALVGMSVPLPEASIYMNKLHFYFNFRLQLLLNPIFDFSIQVDFAMNLFCANGNN